MLTAEHIGARRRGDELALRSPTKSELARAEVLASDVLGLLERSVGSTREDIERALADIGHDASDERLLGALRKLALDKCEFASTPSASCIKSRAEVFAEAARQRRLGPFVRESVMAASAQTLNVSVPELEHLLVADSTRQDMLQAPPRLVAAALVRTWQLARIQGIVLKAREVRCTLPVGSVQSLRALFRVLKFRNLLFTLERQGEAYLLRITGPTHMFQAGTRYGLELALSLRALARLGAEIEADVIWGTDRRLLRFRAHLAASWVDKAEHDEVDKRTDKLIAELGKEDIVAEHNGDVLHIAGVGVVIPDLCVQLGKHKAYIEVLGFWDRQAVFRRADWSLHHRGSPILFCAQQKLRVSEQTLEGAESAALYVYKESIRAKVVAQMLRRLLNVG